MASCLSSCVNCVPSQTQQHFFIKLKIVIESFRNHTVSGLCFDYSTSETYNACLNRTACMCVTAKTAINLRSEKVPFLKKKSFKNLIRTNV